MMEPHLLLTHSGFLRRLARGIVADAAAADDVVQEAWLAALLRPPSDGTRVGAWLAAVTRNLALRSVRADRRRVQRELAGAVRESLPASDLLAERRELTQAIVDCLFSLDEPYRSTILQRFYEDLKPTEIARMSGLSVETVRTRLNRGLQKLRAKLEKRTGLDRRDLCGGLIGLFRPSPVANSMLLGGLVMSGGVKLACLAAVVALLSVPVFLIDRAEQEPATANGPAGASMRPSSPPMEPAEPVAAGDRLAIAPMSDQGGQQEPDSTWILSGTVKSSEGAAISGATVFLEMPTVHPPIPLGDAMTDKAGAYRIDVEEAVTRVSVYVRRGVVVVGEASADGWTSDRHTVRYDLTHERAWQDSDFVLRREPKKLRGRVIDAQGNPLAGAFFGLAPEGSRQVEEIQGTSDSSGRFEVPIEQQGAFHLVACHPGHGLARSGLIDLDPRVDAAVADIHLAEGESLEGVVVSSDGDPVADLPLLARMDDWTGSFRYRGSPFPQEVTSWEGLSYGFVCTDGKGRFRFVGLLPRQYYLHPVDSRGPAGKYQAGTASIRLVVDRYRIRVHVQDELGQPMKAWLNFTSAGGDKQGSWGAVSEWDQRVQPGEDWSVLASVPGRRGAGQSVTIDLARRDTEITLVLPPLAGEPGSIRVKLHDEEGEVIPKFHLSLSFSSTAELHAGFLVGAFLEESGSMNDPIRLIPPGRFRMLVQPYDPDRFQGGMFRPIQSEVEILSGEETEVDLVAESACRVSFTFHPPADYQEELLPTHRITMQRAGGWPEKLISFSIHTGHPDGSSTTRFGGNLVSHAPGVIQDLCAPGDYLFRIEFEGFAAISTYATLEPGKLTNIELSLLPE
ncbi:MAG: sigma-70 family RNA polymerase sigma factor [Planctomycetota bacterium]